MIWINAHVFYIHRIATFTHHSHDKFQKILTGRDYCVRSFVDFSSFHFKLRATHLSAGCYFLIYASCIVSHFLHQRSIKTLISFFVP